jgi:hypothetical protein
MSFRTGHSDRSEESAIRTGHSERSEESAKGPTEAFHNKKRRSIDRLLLCCIK